MSGISANGHGSGYANFRQINYQLSNLVGDSHLNKFDISKFKNYSLQQLNGERRVSLDVRKIPKSSTVFFGQKIKNSDSEGKNESTPDNNKLPGKKIKVLIAEDDEVSSQLLTIILKEISKEIIRTRTGKETIEQCKIHKDIDLILMDIKMPELDGFETTKMIREFNKDVYIIAQTARALEGDREEALFAGCNDYITKPIDRIVLLEKIKKLL